MKALKAENVASALAEGAPTSREIEDPPRFAPGDAVVTRNLNPETHIRLPRYARGRHGTVAEHRGAHVFPDTNALGAGEQPRHLYTVRFEARALWGPDASPRDQVYIDLWEDYLDPA